MNTALRTATFHTLWRIPGKLRQCTRAARLRHMSSSFVAAAAARSGDAPSSWDSLAATAAAKGWGPKRRQAAPFRARERQFEGSTAAGTKGPVVLWRDVFGWCPFCLPTQLFLEEKKISYVTRKVPLKSYMYYDKPQDFLKRVPNGLVPDLTLEYGSTAEQTFCPPDGFDLLPYIEDTFRDAPRMAPAAGREQEAKAFYAQSAALQTKVRPTAGRRGG